MDVVRKHARTKSVRLVVPHGCRHKAGEEMKRQRQVDSRLIWECEDRPAKKSGTISGTNITQIISSFSGTNQGDGIIRFLEN